MKNHPKWKTSEAILWSGKPAIGFFNLPIIRFFHYDHFFFIPWFGDMDSKSPVLTLLFCSLLGNMFKFFSGLTIHFAGLSDWFGLVCSIIVLLLFLLVLTYWERRIAYAFSEKTIFLKIPTIFGLQVRAVPFKNIKQITASHGSDDKSTIYFMLKKSADFRTMDLEGHRPQHHPTFECMANGKAVYAQLLDLHKKS